MKLQMYSKDKVYLETWFIALMIALWPLVIPFISGIVFLIMQMNENKKLIEKYAEFDNLESAKNAKLKEIDEIDNTLKKTFEEKSKVYNKSLEKLADTKNDLQDELNLLNKQINQAKDELSALENNVLIENYNYTDYDYLSSEKCKNELSIIKLKENDLIKSNDAFTITSTDTKRELNNNIKQLIRCFNSECDNIILNLSVKNIDTSRNKLVKSFETLNKIFVTDGIELNKELLELKLEELNLLYTYELKKAQEQEQQKAIKEQMLEEQKVLREIEKQKKEIEKDQTQFSNEVSKLMKYMQKTTNDVEKQLYVDKIKELEEKLKELEIKKETVLEREQNAKAGYVYVISNIGSFGDNIYKIGMTRRLEPMDRVKELSSASVPFEFDVHAMIFSDDAPALESNLHQYFKDNSVNKVNPRKEFFKVSLDEIEDYVLKNFNNTVEFTKTALATEYRQSLELSN